MKAVPSHVKLQTCQNSQCTARTCPDTAEPSIKVMRRSCSSWNAPNSYEGRLLRREAVEASRDHESEPSLRASAGGPGARQTRASEGRLLRKTRVYQTRLSSKLMVLGLLMSLDQWRVRCNPPQHLRLTSRLLLPRAHLSAPQCACSHRHTRPHSAHPQHVCARTTAPASWCWWGTAASSSAPAGTRSRSLGQGWFRGRGLEGVV